MEKARHILLFNLLFFIFLGNISSAQYLKTHSKTYTEKYRNVQQWNVLEITLKSDIIYSDPLNQVEVNGTFIGPNGEKMVRPAFWDGGNTFKIRFAPNTIGLWKMLTSSNDSNNKGLNNIKQTFMCKPYIGKLSIYKHGFIKVSNNKRYFVYDDGKPFFYLGDTHWLYIHERFSTSNKKGVASEFKYIVNKRIKQGFTVYQTEAIQHPHGQNSVGGGGAHLGKDEEAHCNFRDGFDEKDLAGFRNIDRKFKYIADKGLVNANSSICWAKDPAEFPDAYPEQYMYKLARYWVARYGAYPVLWTVAQEIDKNMYKAYDSLTIKKWFAVAKAINDNDVYHHPLTAHMENTSVTLAKDSWWGDKPFHTWWAIQWQQGIQDNIGFVGKEFWNNPVPKPSVLYESAYDGFWTDSKGARAAGYKAFQNGIFGYGYGANGVWNDLYSNSPADYGTDYEMPARYLNWCDGANLPAASQLKYFKDVYNSIPWWKLVPRFDDPLWSTFVDKDQAFIATIGQQVYFVFFSNKVRATGIVKNLIIGKKYRANWYNILNGKYIKIGFFTTSTGVYSVPSKPNEGDWLLIIKGA